MGHSLEFRTGLAGDQPRQHAPGGFEELEKSITYMSSSGDLPRQDPLRSANALRSDALQVDNPWQIANDYRMVIPNRVVFDPAIAHGRPIIRGTRLPVSIVVGSLAGGMTFEEVQREYDITGDDIRAALKFVADLAEQESYHPLPAA